MNQFISELVGRLSLEVIEENMFRGQSQDLGFRQLFGGQVLGQSLSAASQTVGAMLTAHSLHGYFLRAGDSSRPVVYQVDRVRDGRSFSTRRVTGLQKGQPIFTCIASFQAKETGVHHEIQMPWVPSPHSCPSLSEQLPGKKHLLANNTFSKLVAQGPIEIRPVVSDEQSTQKAVKHLWFRAAGKLPDDLNLHRYLLAYASDFELLTTSMLPHGLSVWDKFMQVASLDHAIWFHSDINMDEWNLYTIESPWADGSRGLSRGYVFNQSGKLVASTCQEGLIRIREDWK